ncbi:MerR family transcriptional regulator [Natronincola ferrireducens]|uniref:DNA-binding transcriptional regulator, MerR family n=1 Tax=Natronincola ferrireducens TaxID=393762 RepID=A0A1G8Z8H8_9FIRM|nr:MerR family transcriptional regulator [Natronincola ferrireducens]SDK10934.1 DNA-binding transcriptional regulator, MerR family [Natronincola ferrireducens]
MERYLTIGELSKLFKINVQTLHYYDSIGLLVPNERDSETGYRKYAFDQIYKLATIRYLRRNGYSLNKIESYMEYRNIEYTLESLKKQSLFLRKKWEELINIDTAIQRKIRFIELKQEDIKINHVFTKEYPDRYYLSIGDEDTVYLSDSFYFYPTIVFYENNCKHFGAYMFCEDIEEENEVLKHFSNLLKIPAGKYLCGYHLGPYENITETIETMRLHSNDLALGDRVIAINIIDQFVESDMDKYITELQIPIV